MESPPSLDLLSSVQMAGEPESSLLRSAMDIDDRPELLEDPMDQKENLCVVPEDNLSMSSFPSEIRMQKKRTTRSKGFNLRKSLAWNQAFFTEEGVLNPMELSVLGTSATKSSRNLLSISEMSPSTAHSKCSIRPPLHDLEANRYLKGHTNSHKKATKPRNLFSSINEEAEAHVVSLRTPSGKGISRNIPRSATSSQKRVANVSTTNPTSKLPKFMSTKTHAASLSSTSSTVMLERSKFEQTIPKVNAEKNVGLRTGITKRNSGYASSLPKLSAADHERKTNSQFKSCPANSKMIPKHLSSAKLNEAVTCGTAKTSSSLLQGINNAHGGPAPVHARPSALRMPSPSLGFFCQGKASPSYNNQSHRYAQPSETKIPSLGKHMYLRRESELRPLPSTGQSTKSAAAINFGANVGISSISAIMAGNRLKPPSATPGTQSSMEKNAEMKQADFLYQRPSVILGASHCERDCHELSTGGNLSSGNSVDEQPQVLSSGKSDPDGMEVQYDDSSSDIINDSFGKGSHQFVKPNPSKNAQGACLSARVFEGSELLCPNISSQICFTRELKECESKEIQESDFVVENLAEQSHASAIRNEIHPLTTESKWSAGNSEIVSNIGFGSPARITTCATPLEAKTSFSQGVDQMAYACPNNDVQVDNSSAQSPSKYMQTSLSGSICVTNGLHSALLEELEPPQLEDSNYQCGIPQCQSAQVSSSTKEDVLMPGENISTDKLKQEVQVHGVQLDDSLTQSSSKSLQTTLSGSRTSGLINALSEEIEPPQLEDTEYQCGSTLCESTKDISSTKEDLLMPRDSIRVGKPKLEVQLRPFSDEWLAAVEAFGEDILEKKTGPVQHSPPDKSLPEPNPWSPVKRKAQDIGPYDCTKYSKNNSTTSDSV